MMHLRDIEKVYGKGSLRIIASLGDIRMRRFRGSKSMETALFAELEEQELNNKVLDYLKSENDEEKDALAKEILLDSEYQKYKANQK